MAHVPPELQAHKEWLGQIQQVGLVVSPNVLVRHGIFIERQKSVEKQERLRELVQDEEALRFVHWLTVCQEILEWPDGLLAGASSGPALPDSLTVALPEYDDHLAPTYAVPDPDHADRWLLLIDVVEPGSDFDAPPPADRHHHGWRASPHARLERLLRATGVPIGLLFNGAALRLVYSPQGESSGHLTFRFSDLVQTLGRPMVGALHALLGVERVTDVQQEPQRLPALLKESRKYQNEVSTALAGQVLEALWELVRGFQRANEHAHGALLAQALREAPNEVYGGLLSTLMRLVFVLYAEDRGLMPPSEVYQKHYSISGLFERLRDDEARYPDTMDARFGAWAQLLALFRLVHDGGGHGDMRFPARHGRLFNPDAYPFLEGRPLGSVRVMGEPIDPPHISDGVVFRVLRNLLVLDGERLSYRTLDVEQIGSVYEAMMGFALQQAAGPSIACAPKHVVFDLADLLEQKPKDRAAWLQKQAELKLTGDAVAKATSVNEAMAALGKKVSRYTPHVLPPGAMYLQPTEERRRSGSHYTPRSLTAPIVLTTFRPIFERLGDQATPEQILDLKVCDPAMGSGAFLVEACRLLAERLVRAWEVHKQTPTIPDDEDVLTYARRLVAERCLYGVDKNPFAVDLAKLSLWLATLAREHPFTFLDHALRHGDSLVGLSREQIACFNWETTKQLPLLRTLIDQRVAEAQALREQIQRLATSDDVPEKARLLREANEALHDVRHIGDLVVSAFFERDKPSDRQTLRAAYAGQVEQWLTESSQSDVGRGFSPAVTGPAVVTFHWEIEFPEVFTRPNGGFDAFVGNPPFAGKNTLANSNRPGYPVWLQTMHAESHGNADLVAHFYRRAFDLLRKDGAFGLIATNTIAQGDTRGTGLRWILHHDGTIFAARKRIKWPGEAAVVVSVVHVRKGALSGPFDLDGRIVDRITAFLFQAGVNDDPQRLIANANKSFQGPIVLGMGFTFDDTDKKGVASPISLMHELIRKDPRNAERIFPYIGGEEVNDSPTHAHHRYAINFDQMLEEEARRWPELMAIVEAKVRPERLAQNDRGAKELWWQFIRPRPELHGAIRNLDRVLVCTLHQEHWALTFLPSTVVFSHALGVIATESLSQLCILQCRVHELWARFLGSSLEERFRYTPSDCFETFPFPLGCESNEALGSIGRDYYEFRAALMVRNNGGLTKTYSRFHDPDERDPDIVKLRDLHAAMDRAVLDAYGWTDIQPRCEFILDYEDEDDDTPGQPSRRKKPWRYRWPDDVRDEVLGRLLELNIQRAKEEALAGATAGAIERTTRKKHKSKKTDTPLLD
ncbi:MAG: N-6 DNA methylase [Vicinamibacterales bacterium]|nr:N-6 DNA methylase [Vicinamibacterales bacterium]